MKNLESFGVQEMNAKELNETDGGGNLPRWFGMAFGYLDGLTANLSQTLNDAFV